MIYVWTESHISAEAPSFSSSLVTQVFLVSKAGQVQNPNSREKYKNAEEDREWCIVNNSVEIGFVVIGSSKHNFLCKDVSHDIVVISLFHENVNVVDMFGETDATSFHNHSLESFMIEVLDWI